VKRMQRGLPYQIVDVKKFVSEYNDALEEDKYLICEYFLHGFFLSKNIHVMPNLYVDEVHLREFVSIMINHNKWNQNLIIFQKREVQDEFLVRIKLMFPQVLVKIFKCLFSLHVVQSRMKM